MSNKQIEEMVEVCKRVDAAIKTQGKDGKIECPRCHAEMTYWYGGRRAIDAKCQSCGMHVQS